MTDMETAHESLKDVQASLVLQDGRGAVLDQIIAQVHALEAKYWPSEADASEGQKPVGDIRVALFDEQIPKNPLFGSMKSHLTAEKGSGGWFITTRLSCTPQVQSGGKDFQNDPVSMTRMMGVDYELSTSTPDIETADLQQTEILLHGIGTTQVITTSREDHPSAVIVKTQIPKWDRKLRDLRPEEIKQIMGMHFEGVANLLHSLPAAEGLPAPL